MLQQKLACENMLKQQIRTFGVVDEQILSLLADIPRELFVPENFKQLAYADAAIPLGHSQTMLTPKETAMMLQELKIKKSETILVVGVESGYTVALLAKLAKQVDVIDTDRELIEQAKTKLASLNLDNTSLKVADPEASWKKNAQYQVIIFTGSLPNLPQEFRKNLTRGGRIFAIIGNPPVMEATIVKRTPQQQWVTEKIFETCHSRLPNIEEAQKFVF